MVDDCKKDLHELLYKPRADSPHAHRLVASEARPSHCHATHLFLCSHVAQRCAGTRPDSEQIPQLVPHYPRRSTGHSPWSSCLPYETDPLGGNTNHERFRSSPFPFSSSVRILATHDGDLTIWGSRVVCLSCRDCAVAPLTGRSSNCNTCGSFGALPFAVFRSTACSSFPSPFLHFVWLTIVHSMGLPTHLSPAWVESR